MIRRWTSITRLNNFTDKLKNLNYGVFLVNVKKNIRYKKKLYIYTRRKRKRMTFRKRMTNWTLYNQIFAFWTLDYRNKKSLFRYQYYHLVSHLNLTIFDFNLFKKPIHNDTEDYDVTSYLVTHIPSRIITKFNLLNQFKINNLILSQKLFDKSFIFFFDNLPEIKWTHIPLFAKYDKLLYLPQITKNIDNLFDNFFFSYILNILTEIYKISVLLVFFQINYKNLNLFWF